MFWPNLTNNRMSIPHTLFNLINLFKRGGFSLVASPTHFNLNNFLLILLQITLLFMFTLALKYLIQDLWIKPFATKRSLRSPWLLGTILSVTHCWFINFYLKILLLPITRARFTIWFSFFIFKFKQILVFQQFNVAK